MRAGGSACRLVAVFSALLIVPASGCGKSPAPPSGLQPVSGIVRTADGKPLTTGGMIEFRMATERGSRATAAIDKEGRFSLDTADANSRFPGARPGVYKVTVYRSGSENFKPLNAANPVTIAPRQQESLEIVVSKTVQ